MREERGEKRDERREERGERREEKRDEMRRGRGGEGHNHLHVEPRRVDGAAVVLAPAVHGARRHALGLVVEAQRARMLIARAQRDVRVAVVQVGRRLDVPMPIDLHVDVGVGGAHPLTVVVPVRPVAVLLLSGERRAPRRRLPGGVVAVALDLLLFVDRARVVRADAQLQVAVARLLPRLGAAGRAVEGVGRHVIERAAGREPLVDGGERPRVAPTR